MITSEFTLLLILMVPIAAFATGALIIAAWTQSKRFLNGVTIQMASAPSHHSVTILPNASR